MRISFDKTLYGLGQIKLMQVASKDQHADIGTQAVDKQAAYPCGSARSHKGTCVGFGSLWDRGERCRLDGILGSVMFDLYARLGGAGVSGSSWLIMAYSAHA